ncbi:unnamed protein product [Phytophthora fragariaefolia]|uniref:Unnamed protein product n=1 Tax=Phytophthora fragariaefolia TaxID=1490495 RepID=A0A9W7D7M4_9STRA|nr:unnamed protein product [Phytophthora fragariaefolia]
MFEAPRVCRRSQGPAPATRNRRSGPSALSSSVRRSRFWRRRGGSSLETRPEHLQVLELIVDTATRKAGKLHSCGDEISGDAWAGGDDDDQVEDVIVMAFETAVTCLGSMEVSSPGVDRLLQLCGRLIDALCAIGPTDQGAMGENDRWRDLLCYRWGEAAACLALEMLLVRVQRMCNSTGDKVMISRADKILDAVANAYAHLPVELKTVCFGQATTLISTLVDEGPAYPFTPRMILQLRLLEHLTDCNFLGESDDLDALPWINEYLPSCFDCCGVVLQLMGDPARVNDQDLIGVSRMLDMCLFVIKAGFDYFETRRQDIVNLAEILTPLIIESLVQLANLSQPYFTETSANMPPKIIEARSVEKSLHLLVKMASVVKETEYSTLVKIFELLLSSRTTSNTKDTIPSLVSTCIDVIQQFIFHSEAGAMLRAPLVALLERNDIKALRDTRKIGMQLYSIRDAPKRECTCSSTAISDGEGEFPDRITELVANCLSGIDLGDTVTLPLDQDCRRASSPVMLLRPDAPQWFDEEGSDEKDDRTEMRVWPTTARENMIKMAITNVKFLGLTRQYRSGSIMTLMTKRRKASSSCLWTVVIIRVGNPCSSDNGRPLRLG